MLNLLKSKKTIDNKPFQPIQLESNEELSKKLLYLQFNEEDIHRIQNISSIINEKASILARKHYEAIKLIPEVAELITKYSYEKKFLDTYERYVKSLPMFEPTQAYIDSRKKIGRVHAKIKLSAGWYLASYTRFYELLVPAIHEQLSSDKAVATTISLQKLLNLDAQLALEAYQEDHDFKFISTNSEIIESIIQIDQVADLLSSVESSLHAATNISSSALELSSSVQEIASHAVKVAENTEDMVTSAQAGKETIHHALNGMKRVSEEITHMRERFLTLTEAVNQMTEVASFINEVAEQTSLLSLNAAIEAARAGEEGRGFAVVANEVRKLSVQTSSSVGQIREMIQTVQLTTDDVNSVTIRLEQEVTEKGHQTQEAISQLDTIIEQIIDMGETTSNIAAIIEEQAAATEDISNLAGELLEHVDIIETNATQTGKAIYDVSKHVNQLRNDTIAYRGDISDTHMVRVVKTDHLLWRWWVYNSILGFHSLDGASAGDAHACRLGKWYDRVRHNEQFRNLEVFKQVDEPHQLIHKQVYEVMELLDQGNKAKALEHLEALKVTSVEVVSKLDQLYSSLIHR